MNNSSRWITKPFRPQHMNERRSRRSNALFLMCWLALIWIVAGCQVPNQFRDVSAGQSHSVLTVESTRLPFRGHLHVGAINEQPTSFGNCGLSFRIPAGPTIVHATYSGWDAYGYAPLQFTAIAGCRYTLRRHLADGRNYVTLSEREPTLEQEHVIAQADRR
jgi:hypothetical protein